MKASVNICKGFRPGPGTQEELFKWWVLLVSVSSMRLSLQGLTYTQGLKYSLCIFSELSADFLRLSTHFHGDWPQVPQIQHVKKRNSLSSTLLSLQTWFFSLSAGVILSCLMAKAREQWVILAFSLWPLTHLVTKLCQCTYSTVPTLKLLITKWTLNPSGYPYFYLALSTLARMIFYKWKYDPIPPEMKKFLVFIAFKIMYDQT